MNMEKKSLNKKQKTESSGWADIPEDLLRLIMKNFCFHDLVRSSIVCKNWRRQIKGIRPTTNLPWTFSYRWDRDKDTLRGKLTLHAMLEDLSSGKTFEVKNTNWESHLLWKSLFLHNAEPCASKHGWLLFANNYGKTYTSFFLYNPFSNDSISLPCLRSNFKVATFTKNPTSPDCVIFVSYRFEKKTYIGTCCIGDKIWSTQMVDTDLKEPISDVIYNEEKGEFYCVFPGGKLASFRYFDKRWSFLTQHDLDLHDHGYTCKYYLIEYERQLLLVVKDLYPTAITFRFDWPHMKWILHNSLDDDAVFFNFTSICSSAWAVGEPLGFQGCIYSDIGTNYRSGLSLNLCRTVYRKYPSCRTLGVNSSQKMYNWDTLWIEPPYFGF